MTEPVSTSEYLDLRAAVGWGSPSLGVVQRALAATLAWAVERDADGELVGVARAVGDGMYVLVVDVMVHPRAQRTGVGRRLMESLLGQPAVAGARHATLFAAPDVAPFYAGMAGIRPLDGTYFRVTRDAD